MGRRLATLVAFALSVGGARADDILSGTFSSSKDGPGNFWVITVGGYGGAEPVFPGAKNYTFMARPIVDIRQGGSPEWLGLPNDALSLTLFETENFRIGAAGDLLWNRNHSDESGIYGLHDIDYTLQLGGFAEFYPAPFLRTRVELLQGVTGTEGFTANLMADYVYRASHDWLFTIGPRLQFADTQYVSSFFSVSPVEAAISRLSPFHASGGLDSAGVDATVRYWWNDNISIRGFIEWDRLVGDAAESPIVKLRGSEDQITFGIGASYTFSYRP